MEQKRVIILFTLVLLGFLSVSLRLVDLMVLEHDFFARRANRQHITLQTVEPDRGAIYDARMRELAVNRRAPSFYAVPRKVASASRAAAVLAPVLGVSEARLRKRLASDRNFVWLARKIDEATAARIDRLQLGPAFGFYPEMKRSYPKGSLAAHVLGFVNIDNEGAEGLERAYDDFLRGRGRSKRVGRDAYRRPLSDGADTGVDGGSLVLTLDEDLQYIVEGELHDALRTWKARAAVSIIMEPETGRVLAMGVSPGFSPERPRRPSRWRNRTITDVYEPGSVFKAIVAAAALEEGRVRPSDRFDCSAGFIEVGGRRIRDSRRHGVLSFHEIIQKSSNVGMVQVAQKLGPETLYAYIRRFGFGRKTGIDLPGEVAGILHAPSEWSGSSIAAHAIGYEVAVTPLQMLNAYCAIANGGRLMRPYVVSEVLGPDGRVRKRREPEMIRRVVSAGTARRLTAMLETVVQKGGTAVKASILGNSVAGKTGTARKYDPALGRYSREKYMSTFVGFVPAEAPRLAIIVVVDEPKGDFAGGKVAAPVFRRIAERAMIYLNIPRGDMGNVLLVSDARP